MSNHPLPASDDRAPRQALHDAVIVAVAEMRAARAAGAVHRAAEWAQFVTQITDIIIDRQRRRLP